jgi:uncharacterized RDD family membrane protein YckC
VSNQKPPVGTGPKPESASGELTPLQRYLKKQAKANLEAGAPVEPEKPRRSVPKPSVSSTASPPAAEPAEEFGIPSSPPPPGVSPSVPVAARPSTPVSLNLTIGKPAGFWVRFFAYVVDLLIIWALCTPLKMGLAMVYTAIPDESFGYMPNFYDRGWIIYHVVLFFYFGWFYAERGASPGKLLMGLRVIEVSRKKKLGYWRTFFRESLGKYISGLPLALGYLIAALRSDHKALHDLLFDTQVYHQPPKL